MTAIAMPPSRQAWPWNSVWPLGVVAFALVPVAAGACAPAPPVKEPRRPIVSFGPRQQLTMARAPNGHSYQRIDQAGVTFGAAKAAAEAMMFGSRRGHLAIFETATYQQELAFVHQHVYAPGVAPRRVYWVGASRPASAQPPTAGWTWVDGTEVPVAITSTWSIDFHEGPVAEGSGFWRGPENSQLGDYAEDNPTDLVGGYIVEFEPFDG